MTTKTLAIIFCSAAAALAAVAACDRNARGTGLPTAPTAGSLLLEIRGSGTVAPGGTVQWTAIAHRAGTVRDVTAEAHWNSSNRSVVSVASGGLLTGYAPGDATIQVNLSPVTAVMEIIVVPPGTYRVAGLISEADGSPVPSARVAAVSGVGAGPSTTTSLDGRYRLYGVSGGDVDFRVTKDGYEPLVQRQTIVDHTMVNAHLTLLRSRPQVSGPYTLTITASGECDFRSVSEDLRTRTYPAVVVQRENRLEVRLEGTGFEVSATGKGNGFVGVVEPDGLLFSLTAFDSLSYGYYRLSYGDVVEKLAEERYLIISGTVKAFASGSEFSGSLDGSFETYLGNLRVYPNREWRCASSGHRFTLRR